MTTARLFVLLFLPWLLCACETGRVQLRMLPTSEACTSTDPGGVQCRLAQPNELPTDLGMLVPYAQISASGTKSPDGLVEQICTRLQLLHHPDLVLWQFRGQSYAGSTSAYMGFGMWTSVPTYENHVEGLACRLAPAYLPLRPAPDGTVLAVDESVRSCGIIEGDRLLSVADQPIQAGDAWSTSPHFRVFLGAKPGDAIKLVWIRPGTGRMEGNIAAVATDRAMLNGLPAAPNVRQWMPATRDESLVQGY